MRSHDVKKCDAFSICARTSFRRYTRRGVVIYWPYLWFHFDNDKKKTALTKRHRGWPHPFLICIQIFSIGQSGKRVEGNLISRLVTLKPAAAVWYSLVASIHNLACINEIQNCHGREVGGCWWRANTAVTSLRGDCITAQIYAFKWHKRIYVYSPT
jgi:hypothetical protein